MGLNGSILRSVTMVLVLALCCGRKPGCNYTEIRDTYRGIVLVQLQSQNVIGSYNISKKDNCPSDKAKHILRSIYNMTQKFLCHSQTPEMDLEKPVKSMELLTSCSQNLVKKYVCPTRKWKKKRRLKLINIIKALITCWEKFQSILSQNL